MDDLISRQAVLDFPKLKSRNVWGEVIYESVDVEDIKKLPSVKPPTGHWIKMPLIEAGQTFSHKCSLCGRKILVTDVGLSEFPYCHCGARMIELQENEVDNG